MNILIHSQNFWPENFQINDIAIELVKKGHNVDVLTGKPNYPEGNIYNNYKAYGLKIEIFKKISIFRVPILPRYSGSNFFIAVNYLSFLFSSLIFSPFVLRKRKYDIIFVYGTSPIFQSLPASLLSFIKKAPLALWVQDLWPESVSATGHIKSKFLLYFLKKIVSFTYYFTDLILVQSKAFIPFLNAQGVNRKIIYYPNSVNNAFYNQQNNNNLGINIPSMTSGFTVVFAGNVGEAQSFETIIEAAILLKDYNDIKIIIFGSGSKIGWLKGKIKSCKIKNIYLEGSFPQEIMAKILPQASTLLVSLNKNLIFRLTIPNKLQAYLAAGRPIIASLDGEGARIVKEANAGLTSPAEDFTSLANSIITLYNLSNSELQVIGENGRMYYKQNFEMSFLVNKLLTYFDELSNESNAR